MSKTTSTSKQAYWKGLIDDWSQSGQKQSEYCRQRNIKLSHFYHWKSYFKKKDGEPQKSETSGKFIPLAIEQSSSAGGASSELVLKIAGAEIIVTHETDTALLKKVMQTIGGQHD